MKLTTIALSSVLMLGSTLALAQAGGSNDAAAASGATGGPARAGSSSTVKGDAAGPSGTRDSKAPVRAAPRLLPPVVRLVGQLGLVPPALLKAIPTPQVLPETPSAANNNQPSSISIGAPLMVKVKIIPL
jgi:hypothetical protein